MVVVARSGTAFSNAVATADMQRLQTPLTSVLRNADSLPGVSVHEGDTFGFDDWSTTLSMRGFKVNLDEQQLGITVDGMPNGGSNYGGGAKANRFIDTPNLADVVATQGTADIRSRSNEALGGTLDFTTGDPREDRAASVLVTRASFDGAKHYLRLDTGRTAAGTGAWMSASRQSASDWIDGSADNERSHVAMKVDAALGGARVTGYAAWDDTHEDNYQRLFSAADFAADPGWDRLGGTWTGVPHVDQAYRPGWSTLRENAFAYLSAERELAGLRIEAGGYFHESAGRGDWLPPYLVDIVADGGGVESEHAGAPAARGGMPLGLIHFVDPSGVALRPRPGCVSSLTFPYGGAGAEADPACHAAGARAVQSYRHTHYDKTRGGAVVDVEWRATLPGGMTSRLEAGLWLERATRKESRDWHEVADTRVGFAFEPAPYWTQYMRRYPAGTRKWYVEETVTAGRIRLNAGARVHRVRLHRYDRFRESPDARADSAPRVLYSGGVTVQALRGLEAFAGYAENAKALSDLLLERPASALREIEPERARNAELGLRYSRGRAAMAATWYDVDFRNRIVFVDERTVTGPDFLEGTEGEYVNAGGVASRGFEVAGRLRATDSMRMYLAYTRDTSRYTGAGLGIGAVLQHVEGNRVTGIPGAMLVAAVQWRRGAFAAGASHKVTGRRYVDLGNRWRLPRHGTTDLHVEATWQPAGSDWSLRLRATVNNLADERYLAGTAGNGAWLGAPRTVSVSLEASFH